MKLICKLTFALLLAVVLLMPCEVRADTLVITGGTLQFSGSPTLGTLTLSGSNFNLTGFAVDTGISQSFGNTIGSTVSIGGSASTFSPRLVSGTINGVAYQQVFAMSSIFFQGSGVLQPDGTITTPFTLTGMLQVGENRFGTDLEPPYILSTQITASGIARLVFADNGAGIYDFRRATFTFNDPTTVPEPVSLVLFGTGLAGAAIAARRRQRSGKPPDGE